VTAHTHRLDASPTAHTHRLDASPTVG